MTKRAEIPNTYYQAAENWYEDTIQQQNKMMTIYRGLCFGLFGCVACVTLLVTVLVNRETVQPFLALVDKRTGEVTTPTRLNAQALTDNWRIIRHSVTNYVMDRESYNFLNLNAPYKNVLLMSSPEVAEQVNQAIRPELNPNSPIKTLAQHHYITVNIHSIAKMSDTGNLLDVRFTTNTVASNDNKVESSQEWRVVMRWELNDKQRSLQEWDKNPIGFAVTLYDKQPVA